MLNSKKVKFYILLSFLFQISLNEMYVYDVSTFLNAIKQIEISEEDSKNIIYNLQLILERYVYLDILKKPPQPQGNKDYYNTLDLSNTLSQINTEKRPLYEFYRDVKIVINFCQDLHLNINLKKELLSGLSLENTLFVSPYILSIEGGEVYAIPFNAEYFSQTAEDEELIKAINDNYGTPIDSINGLDPIEYIQHFNGDFMMLKSPQAQFILNQRSIPMTQVMVFPFEIYDLTDIKIKFRNQNSEVSFYYKVVYDSNSESFLSKYFILPEKNENNFNNIKMYKQKDFLYKTKKYSNRKLNEIKWDKEYADGQLKCRVDEENKLNIIYQSSFTLPEDEAIDVLTECFESFYKNDYKIVVIEQFNVGGKVLIADVFKELLILNQPSIDYASYRYNDDVRNNVAINNPMKDIETCNINSSYYIFDKPYVEDDYETSVYGEKIKHRRTQIFDISFAEQNNYTYYKNKKNLRKPHEIIIFTDGFSYSATSIFIKGIQLNGGAIIVGYGGNPREDNFDSSQGPSPVFSTEHAEDQLSKNIESYGLTLTYPIMEVFSKLDNEKDTEANYPLEYQINPIDERVQLFNSYDDTIYQEFIDKALEIFKKYENKCNSKNKNLLFITEKCKFDDSKMHGGYQCNDDGVWNTKSCIPSYCDTGYYFDRINKKCIKNACLKDNENENKNKKNKLFLILAIVSFGIFLIFLIAFIVCTVIGGFNNKYYLLIPITLFLMSCAAFTILYFII